MPCKVSFRNLPFFTFASLLIALGISPAFDCAAQSGDETKYIAILADESSPKPEKAMACKKLAVFGSADCIDELAPLLQDPELTSWARIALEAIEAPAAETALLEATDQLQGLPLVGVINSLGVKRSKNSVSALAGFLDNENASVAEAAAISLGKIGGNLAANALKKKVQSQARDQIRSAAAEGLVRCAEGFFDRGELETAASLYDFVLESELPKQRMVEATRGAILSRGVAGIELILSSLASNDVRMRGVALKAARQLKAQGAIDALISAIDEVPESQRAMYLLALGDRTEKELVPVLQAIVENRSDSKPNRDTRLVAVKLLQNLGNVDCLESLTQAALSSDEELANAAMGTLANIDDEQLDLAIQRRVSKADSDEKRILIRLIGDRRIPAVDSLLAAVSDSDTRTRLAALTSLGDVATLAEIPALISRSTKGEANEETKIALAALKSACVRIPDQAAVAKNLADALRNAQRPAQLVILETLAGMGGSDALQVLGKVADTGDVELQNAATRLLGDWMSVDAGPVLMTIAEQPKHAYRIRALRAYLRLVRQFVMDQNSRNKMAQAAAAVATRDAEKTLILDAAQRYPSEEMLQIALDLCRQPGVASAAQKTALAIASKIKSGPELTDLIEKIDLPRMKIEVTKAIYGAKQQTKDVTKTVQAKVSDSPLILLGQPSYNLAFGIDPAPGLPKKLTLQYSLDGKRGEAVFDENDTIVLPMP